MYRLFMTTATFALALSAAAHAEDDPIVYDAELYISKAQNAERWSIEDAWIDAVLSEYRKENGGKPHKILYILLDDVGFGDMGSPTMNAVRGYKTPAVNEIAREGMRLARMYTEPSCTPTRVAFMTGRHPVRNGMANTAVDISGFGLAEKEVTLAEVLTDVGYNTVHIGKWHLGDIREAWPNFQGFDYAGFPIHQQGQLTIYHDDGADEEVAISLYENNYDSSYTLDNWFRSDASAMVAGVEGVRGENVREVNMEPGERWTEKKYHEMNVDYQNQAIEQLRLLSEKEEPFFLNYWPLYPIVEPRTTTDQYTTPNGGTYVEKWNWWMSGLAI